MLCMTTVAACNRKRARCGTGRRCKTTTGKFDSAANCQSQRQGLGGSVLCCADTLAAPMHAEQMLTEHTLAAKAQI